MQCGTGKVYTICGSPCQPTCLNSTVSCLENCVETCVCEEGLVSDGDICVPPEQCGCEDAGYYYSVGMRLEGIHIRVERLVFQCTI